MSSVTLEPLEAEFAQQNAVEDAETPAKWFNKKFPALARDYDEAVLEHEDKETRIVSIRDLNEDFLAATLGEHGTPDAPTVFVPTEERFYSYSSSDGIFISQRDPVVLTRLSLEKQGTRRRRVRTGTHRGKSRAKDCDSDGHAGRWQRHVR